MELKLVPYESCGIFTPDTSYTEVKSTFADHVDLKKSMGTHISSEIVGGDIFVYYNEKGLCEALEIFNPLYVDWNGIKLGGGRKVDEVRKELEAKGLNCVEDTYGFDVREIGASIYCHRFGEFPDLPIDAVFVTFSESFFDI